MDSPNCCNPSSATVVAQPPRSVVRSCLGSRAALILGGVAVIGVGLALGWNWVVALGIAPLLLSLAPCLIMCALGVCMMGMMGSSSKPVQSADGQPATIGPPPPAPMALRGGPIGAWLSGRRGLIIGGVVILVAGLGLGWNWVVALGIAPVILALVPCAAMCALGVCMMPRGNAAGAKPDTAAGDKAARTEPTTPQTPAA